MTTITPAATLSLKDTSLSPNPNPVPFAGVGVVCPVGALAQDVVLPAATAGASLPFPSGVTTGKIVALYAATLADLIVTYKGQTHAVPLGQPFFLYNALASDITISTAIGGKLTCVVGG
ncbi:MAG: hypothetical protein V4510_10085 [bacterium]